MSFGYEFEPVPEGPVTIARRFNAGFSSTVEISPDGTLERPQVGRVCRRGNQRFLLRLSWFSRPGRDLCGDPVFPALKRRASIMCPSGTEQSFTEWH